METPFQPRDNELLLIKLFRLLSGYSQRVELARLAGILCQQLPSKLFTELEELDEDDGDDAEYDVDTKIGALLKETLPSWHEVPGHVGDYYLDMVERAIGDDLAGWSTVLEGLENDDESLIEEFIESVSFYSDQYPGFEPSWGAEAVQDFLYDWRSSFFNRLIVLVESKEAISSV
jgi:hypothetical protein